MGRKSKTEGACTHTHTHTASQVALVVKNPPGSAGEIRDMVLIPGLGRPSGGGHGNPLQYSCLENPMDRGAWWATVHGVANSLTRLKQLSIQVDSLYCKAELTQCSKAAILQEKIILKNTLNFDSLVSSNGDQ